MPRRGNRLNDFEKGQISALNQEGKSISDISRRLNRSYNCIKQFLRCGGQYSYSTGRPNALNERQRRQIVRVMTTENAPSLRQLIAELNLSVSPTTISKFLTELGWKYVRALKVPALTENHKIKRFQWAKKLLSDLSLHRIDLLKITFSDEKRFLLDGPDGCRHYWASIADDRRFYGKKVFSKSLVVWGGIGHSGTTSLYMTESNVDSDIYINIIETAYKPFHKEGFILQQDNARPHVSHASLQYLQNNDIELLEWPACSPDANPIENLWGIMVQRLYRRGRQYSNISQLKEEIIRVWDQISLEEVQNLVRSFPSRLAEICGANGGNIKEY